MPLFTLFKPKGEWMILMSKVASEYYQLISVVD